MRRLQLQPGLFFVLALMLAGGVALLTGVANAQYPAPSGAEQHASSAPDWQAPGGAITATATITTTATTTSTPLPPTATDTVLVPTVTSTPTLTATATAVVTETATPGVTSTPTAGATETGTVVATGTTTAVATGTGTVVATGTTTAVATGTGTVVATGTPTAVATGTGTVVTTGTPTAVATGTGTVVTTRTPTAVATGTAVATATRTGVATSSATPVASATAGLTGTPAATVSPTATVCAVTFDDVDPTNPFYSFIRCLACRQIVSGYADGTFRWGNDVTRGQLSKIIAGAAQLSNNIPSSQQTFADVPNSNVFWVFIEQLAGIGAISGYDCGGAGEPCDSANRAYFRWGAQATRGQISKITAVTAGWNGPIPTTQQTFADVPATNPFWLWIEELAVRNVISGYDCGGAGEPCDPSNRAYFRWGWNATRGQMSKIAGQSFFPDCQTPAR